MSGPPKDEWDRLTETVAGLAQKARQREAIQTEQPRGPVDFPTPARAPKPPVDSSLSSLVRLATTLRLHERTELSAHRTVGAFLALAVSDDPNVVRRPLPPLAMKAAELATKLAHASVIGPPISGDVEAQVDALLEALR